MKCVKCGKQKGKRACPALGGDICATCCGTHRLKEISCPAGCTWLGGLAVVAGLAEPPPEDVRAAANEIAPAVIEWMRTYRDRQWFGNVALDEVFGDDDLDDGDNEWLMGMLTNGLHHAVVDEKGRRVVDIMLAERARDLPPAQVAVLRSLGKSWFSAFRVERVDVDVGILLRDTVDDREIYVHEKTATHSMKPLDVLLAFISTTGGVEMFQGVVGVPPTLVMPVIDELRRLLADAGTTDRVAATPRVWGWTLGYLRERVRDFRPELRNTDREMLYPSKARFDVVDEDALRRALATSAELDVHPDGKSWQWRRGEGEVALSLGQLSLEGTTLILEVNSRERLKRGKALLTSLAGAAAKHRLDEHMDMDRMLDDARGRPSRRQASKIPDDVQREMIGEAVRRAYANILDERVPMLGNKSPRQVARAGEEGKRRVSEWLNDLERSLRPMPGASDAVDVNAWRVELGIEPRSVVDDVDDDDLDDEDEQADDDDGEPDWFNSLDPDLVGELAERIENGAKGWLDDPTPLLDGQTPRAAARDPAMRFRVHLLVDGIDECLAFASAADIDAIVKALGLDDTDLVYDPSTAPDVETWLRYHVRERELAVRRAHEKAKGAHPKLGIKDIGRHDIEHQVVESWIARDAHDAPRALERLCSAGLTRHEAIHALGDAFARVLQRDMETMEAEGEVDEDIAGELAAVTPDAWRGTAN